MACMPAAEPVVELPEHPHRRPEPLDITDPDPDPAGPVIAVTGDAGPTSQRSDASFHAAGWTPPLERALAGQISPPQLGPFPAACAGTPDTLARIEVGCLPGMRQAILALPDGSAASPSACRAAGGMPSPSAKASNVVEAFGARLRRTYSLSRPDGSGQLRDLP